jgi:hypothetical protein
MLPLDATSTTQRVKIPRRDHTQDTLPKLRFIESPEFAQELPMPIGNYQPDMEGTWHLCFGVNFVDALGRVGSSKIAALVRSGLGSIYPTSCVQQHSTEEAPPMGRRR